MSDLLIDNVSARELSQQMIARGLIRHPDNPKEIVAKAIAQGLIRQHVASQIEIEAEFEKETDPVMRRKLYQMRNQAKKERLT